MLKKWFTEIYISEPKFEKGELTMTDMKRTTVSLPDDLVAAIDKLREREDFAKLTYSEVLRRLIIAGLPESGKKKK